MEYCPVAKECWNFLQWQNYDYNQYGLSNQPNKFKFCWILESCISFAEKCRSLLPKTIEATNEVQTSPGQLPAQQQTEEHCHNFDPRAFSLVSLFNSKSQITIWCVMKLLACHHGDRSTTFLKIVQDLLQADFPTGINRKLEVNHRAHKGKRGGCHNPSARFQNSEF